MIRILRFLFTDDWHLHEWETIREIDIVDGFGQTPVGYKYECRCVHCGKIRSFKV
jgi:uncharacterized protein CbrC (UPF0167 family)